MIPQDVPIGSECSIVSRNSTTNLSRLSLTQSHSEVGFVMLICKIFEDLCRIDKVLRQNAGEFGRIVQRTLRGGSVS